MKRRMLAQLAAIIVAFAVSVASTSAPSAYGVPAVPREANSEAVAQVVAIPLRLAEGIIAPIDTTPPADTTLPPAEAQSATSIMADMVHILTSQLSAPRGQLTNAAIALVFGLVLVIDGQFMFKWAVVGMCFVLMYLFAHNEAAAIWNFSAESRLPLVAGLELGVLAAWAALYGIEGVMVVVGGMAGASVAHLTQVSLVNMGFLVFQTNAWLQLALYSLFTIWCMYLVSVQRHTRMVAAFCPFLGGALVSSAMSFFATGIAQAGWMPFLDDVPGRTVGGVWVDFLLLLIRPGAKDVGVFVGAYDFKLNQTVWSLDRSIGSAAWCIIFLVGTCYQSKILRKSRAVSKVAVKKSKSGLGNALLPK